MDKRMGRPRRGQVAEGVPGPGGMRGTVVYFDPETFSAVRAQALMQGCSFNERVRTLVEWGLEIEEKG